MTRVILPDDDLPPISYLDPEFEIVEGVSPWRFMLAGLVAVAVVIALLVAGILLGGAQ